MERNDRVLYFLPESNDLVDPEFDFEHDAYGSERHITKQDVYAHEIYDKPNFDGLLVTKSNINEDRATLIQAAGGVHPYYKVDPQYSIMGDCGAFQYASEDLPPYTCEEICEYYDALGFDYGISLDHIIFEFDLEYDTENTIVPMAPTEEMMRRYRLSLKNAKTILELKRTQGLSFEPIGSAQAWSPKSYHAAVKELISYGYKYIAIGGVAKATDAVITAVLNEIGSTVVAAGVSLHVLGVARYSLLELYRASGVVSCDSSAPIFQAFKSQKDNYHMPDKKYTAIRIPAVRSGMSPKVRKLLKPYQETASYKKEESRLYRLEMKALRALRAYASGDIELSDAMKHLVRYEDQFAGEKRYYPLFEDTLRDRPWEQCNCPICKSLGVDVVLLRGNNRNRRRGFHNTYVFYKDFCKLQK